MGVSHIKKKKRSSEEKDRKDPLRAHGEAGRRNGDEIHFHSLQVV